MNDLIWDIIEAINVLLEFIIVYVFHKKLFEKRYDTKWYYYLCYAIGAAVLYMTGIITNNSYVLISVSFALLYLQSLFMYNGHHIKKLFSSAMFITFIVMSEILFISIMTILGLGAPSEIVEKGPSRIIGMIGTKVLYFWMIYILCNLINKKSKSIPLKHWLTIIMMPIFSTIILCMAFQSMTLINSDNILNLISVLGLLYINISVFEFFETYQKKLRLSVLEQIIEVENTNYKLIEESYKELRKLKHDMVNEIAVVKNLIINDDIQTAENIIDKISKDLGKITAVCYTGEPIIDSIINIKFKLAAERKISISKRINVSSLHLDKIELCRALGNALDNAIEGCQRCLIDNPCIYFSMQQIEDKIAIEISNSSEYVNVYDLQTSKNDLKIHGIGISSIRSSVDKMKGYMSIDYCDGIFYLKMVLSNQLITSCAV